MLNDGNQLTADKVKSVIQNDPAKATRLLIEFAKKFAVDNILVHKAIMLSNDYTNAISNEEKVELDQDMINLVEEIVDNHKQKSGTEEAKKRKDIHEKIAKLDGKLEIKNDVVLKGKALTKTYKKSNFTLSNLDLELRLGEITGVVGENGNGKTTLFEILVGNLAKDSGELSYPYLQHNGKLNWFEIKNQIAYVPQNLPVWKGSLRYNLFYEAATHGIHGKTNKEDVEFIISRLGLFEYANLKWNQLSGGFKMRFAIAKALVWKPKLLVLDEPLAHLDIITQLTVLNDINALSRSLRFPVAVIISSQHLHEIEKFSDNLIFLRQGKAVYNGKTKDLGLTRKHNTFEFETPLSLTQLEEKLLDFKFISLSHNGLSYVMNTSIDVSQQDFIQALASRDIEISYFRNTSHSSKQLFK